MFLCKLCLMCGSVGLGGGKHGSMLALLGVVFFSCLTSYSVLYSFSVLLF